MGTMLEARRTVEIATRMSRAVRLVFAVSTRRPASFSPTDPNAEVVS